jgi:hypothetical protein
MIMRQWHGEAIVQLLLERRDIEVECESEDGLRPLSAAGSEEITRLLLEKDQTPYRR